MKYPYHENDWVSYGKDLCEKYSEAIKTNGIKKVVNLSTYGAHRLEGNGPINSIEQIEKALDTLTDTKIIHLRAGFFYSNLNRQFPFIKSSNSMGSNYGSTERTFLLEHTNDIADVAFEALTNDQFESKEPYYVVSDVRSYAEVATVIGKAIGNEGMPWVPFSHEVFRKGIKEAGFLMN